MVRKDIAAVTKVKEFESTNVFSGLMILLAFPNFPLSRSPMKTSGTSCMLSRSRSQHKGGSSNYPLTRSLAASWFQPTTSFLVFCRHSTSSSDIPNIAG